MHMARVAGGALGNECRLYGVSEQSGRCAAERMPEPNCTPDCLSGMPSLAMVYAPCQVFADLYELDEGLRNGTIFRALNKPFQPGYRKRGNNV